MYVCLKCTRRRTGGCKSQCDSLASVQVHGGAECRVCRRCRSRRGGAVQVAAREAARNWSGARAGQSLAAAGSDAPPARLATQCTRCLAAASLRARPSTSLLNTSRQTRRTLTSHATYCSPYISPRLLLKITDLPKLYKYFPTREFRHYCFCLHFPKVLFFVLPSFF